MEFNHSKWIRGYNDGYVLGKYDNVVTSVIHFIVRDAKDEYGMGLRYGHIKGREFREQDRQAQLQSTREKSKDKGLDQER